MAIRNAEPRHEIDSMSIQPVWGDRHQRKWYFRMEGIHKLYNWKGYSFKPYKNKIGWNKTIH